MLFGFAAGVAALVVRWRRAPSGGIERRQIPARAGSAPGPGRGPRARSRAARAVARDAAILAAFSLVPAAIGIAILRHHLYDIDVVLNRSLVYGGLTAGVVALYVALVWAAPSRWGRCRPRAAGHRRRRRLGPAPAQRAAAGWTAPCTASAAIRTRPSPGWPPGCEAATRRGGAPRRRRGDRDSLRLPYVAVETAAGEPADGSQHRCPPPRRSSSATRARTWGGWWSRAGTGSRPRPATGAAGRPRPPRRRRGPRRRARRCAACLPAAAGRGPRGGTPPAAPRPARRPRADAGRRRAGLDAAAGAGGPRPGIGRGDAGRAPGRDGGAVDDIRRLVYDLRPPALDELGLVGAVRQQATGWPPAAPGLDGPA